MSYTQSDLQGEASADIWGVWNLTSKKWCCLRPGDANDDRTWRSHRDRAEIVFELMKQKGLGEYEIRRYEREFTK